MEKQQEQATVAEMVFLSIYIALVSFATMYGIYFIADILSQEIVRNVIF